MVSIDSKNISTRRLLAGALPVCTIGPASHKLARPTMELRHLRYFVALADELSFTRAARRLNITQSTLSHQIKQLEEEIGHALFDRIGKRTIITEAGEMLLLSATRSLRELDEGLLALR